jgi:hypothetical protein
MFRLPDANGTRDGLLQPSAIPLRHVMTSLAPSAIARIALNIAAQADAMRAAMPINFLNLDSRSCQRSTSKSGSRAMAVCPIRLRPKRFPHPPGNRPRIGIARAPLSLSP